MEPTSARTRGLLASVALVAAIVAAVLIGVPISPGQGHRATSSGEASAQTIPAAAPVAPREHCLRLAASPPDYGALGDTAYRRIERDWRDACRQAIDTGDDDPRIKVALAGTLPHAQRAETVAWYKAAATQHNAEANYQLYEQHKSWDQRLDRPPLVSRAEADQALRRAAELGHSYATFTLALLLERGGIVKRDLAAARAMAQRALDGPLPKDVSRGQIALLLARLLARSDDPADHQRGLAMLEKLAAAGQFGAASGLAVAIRGEDPARARRLFEQTLRSDPGGAIPPLAEMLIAGEGGAADPPRALKLLRGGPGSDVAALKTVLGRLVLDGQLVPRDVQEAARLIDLGGQWDVDVRIELLRLLAAHPEARVNGPDRVLYAAGIAAELGEPGAGDALIALRLSDNAQFRDPAEGCKVLRNALARGDPVAPDHQAKCTAN